MNKCIEYFYFAHRQSWADAPQIEPRKRAKYKNNGATAPGASPNSAK